jgi:hypothetical protein
MAPKGEPSVPARLEPAGGGTDGDMADARHRRAS